MGNGLGWAREQVARNQDFWLQISRDHWQVSTATLLSVDKAMIKCTKMYMYSRMYTANSSAVGWALVNLIAPCRCVVRGEIFNGCNPQVCKSWINQPSPLLETDVDVHTAAAQFINALMMKLKLVFYMSNEEIFKKDDLSREFALLLQVSWIYLWTCWPVYTVILFWSQGAHKIVPDNIFWLVLMQGACYVMDEEKVKRIIRHDVSSSLSVTKQHLSPPSSLHGGVQVPDVAPVLGELAFYTGIPQPVTIRARWLFLFLECLIASD